MIIENENVVGINYKLTNSEGSLLDSTEGREPLLYIQGKNNIMPSLEGEILGKTVNDKFIVTLTPDQAYGNIDTSLVLSIGRDQFEENANHVKLGMQFNIESDQGKNLIATVIEIKDNHIVVDGNHPLAGETLKFDVHIDSVRKATREELSLGHIQQGTSCCDSNKGCCD